LLDRDSAVPLYLQVRNALRSEILAVESSPSMQSQALREARAYGVVGVLLFPVEASVQDLVTVQLLAAGSSNCRRHAQRLPGRARRQDLPGDGPA
jgi:hypothetical protein